MQLIVTGRLIPQTIKPNYNNNNRWIKGEVRLSNQSRHVLLDIRQKRLPFTFTTSSVIPVDEVIALGNISTYPIPDTNIIWKTLDIDNIITQDSPIFEMLGVSFQEAKQLIRDKDTEFLKELGSYKLAIKKQITDLLGSRNKFADTLLELYGDRAYQALIDNPWEMVHILPYYTMEHADKVAKTIGLDKEDPKRFYALFRYLLDKEFTSHAHTYMSESSFLAFYWMNFSETMTLEEYQELATTSESPIIKSDLGYHPARLYRAETASHRYLLNAVQKDATEPDMNVVRAVLSSSDITLTDEQTHALTRALSDNFHVVTGGPGTGKTTILKAILAKMTLIENATMSSDRAPFLLVAPTGKAAARMQEQTGYPAHTIHSAFTILPDYGLPNVEGSADRLSHIRYVVVDEASMLDSALFGDMIRVFNHMKHMPKVLLLGDVDQLPPVQNGQVFKDIIDFINDKHPELLTRLTVVKRQEDGSSIPELAKFIREGSFPDVEWFRNQTDIVTFGLSNKDLHSSLTKGILEPNKHNLEDIQILTPYRNGPNDDTIHALNKVVAPIFNPVKKDEKVVGYGNPPRQFRVGDRIVNRTNLSTTVVNGSMGTVTRIDSDSSDLFEWIIHVEFDNGENLPFVYENWTSLEPAYAITIHSSQGSEYDTVVLALTRSGNTDFLTRNLLYTAITRASKKVILVGDYITFTHIAQNEQKPRRTALGHWLKQ